MAIDNIMKTTILQGEEASECDVWSIPSMEGKKVGAQFKKKVLPSDFEREKKEHKKKLEDSIKKGYDDGFAAGKAKGHDKAYNEFKEKLESLDSLMVAFDTGVKGLTYLFEQQIKDLSLEIAKAVIRSEVSTNESIIQNLLQEALNCLPKKASDIRVHLNQADIDMLASAQEESLVQAIEHVKLVANESVARGGCLVETESSRIDASIEKRFNEILTAIDNSIEDES